MDVTYQKVIETSKIIEKVISMESGPNPYKGECYVASALLYHLYKGQYMHFCRKLDIHGTYHWWIYYNDGIDKGHIDITRKQYYIENEPCPSDNEAGIGIADRLTYKSYKKRIQALKDKVDAYMESRNHR